MTVVVDGTSVFDQVLSNVNTEQTCDDNAPANSSGDLISGWVYDTDGQTPMSGIRLRITSIDASPWSAETATDGSGYWHP